MEARNILSRFSILLVVLFSTNCSKDIADDQVSGIVDIQKIEPEEGKATTEVTLTGTYFETDINKVSLFFNNTEAVITSLTETTLKTTVPRGAETGTIKIVIDGEETLGPEFTYIITPAQVITVAGLEIAGDIIGPIAESSFNIPIGILKNTEGIIYVADFNNHKIKKIDTDSGVVTILAGSTIGNMDGTGAQAMLKSPRLMVFDADENIIFSDQGNHQIKRITPNGVVTTVAGTGIVGFENGISTTASFRAPMGVVVDALNNIYVSDFNNHSIRKIGSDGMVTTLAGNGTIGDVNGVGVSAQFNNPVDISLDKNNNLYVTDFRNHKIKKINPDGTVTTAAGSGILGDVDGTINEAQFNFPQDVLVATDGTIYIADTGNHKIKKITADGLVTTLAGTGVKGHENGDAMNATFTNPRELLLDELTDEIYVVTDHIVRKIIPAF